MFCFLYFLIHKYITEKICFSAVTLKVQKVMLLIFSKEDEILEDLSSNFLSSNSLRGSDVGILDTWQSYQPRTAS